MALLPVIVAPDPLLKKVAEPVGSVDDGVRRLMDDMLETMYAAPGVGLAAPQVGALRRVIVADVAPSGEPRRPLRIADPRIVESSVEVSIREEGCLSLPEHYAEVERPERVRLQYLDYDGAVREEEFDGYLATCIQHEIDHLDGVLFVDRISAIRRGMILRKLARAKRARGRKPGAARR